MIPDILKLNWTHKQLKITDIRKLNKLYVITVNDSKSKNQIDQPLFVKDVIFEERLKSYFLKDPLRVTREEILSVFWNMYITKGYYIKIDENGEVTQHDHDENKWYVSYLEIDGYLGSFSSIYREKELIKKIN
jgi:hypothetical protein